MQTVFLVLAGVGALIIETTLLEFLKIAGVKPDLLLLLLVCVSRGCRAGQGAALGLVYGLLEDLAEGRLLGLNALIKMLVGYTVGASQNRLNWDNTLVPLCFTWAASMGSGLLFLLLSPWGGISYPWSAGWLNVILPASIYNTCLAFFCQIFYRRRAEWAARKGSLGS
ncbi:MAG: rod shape-determining protein MreD [Moorellaceae bacterium]